MSIYPQIRFDKITLTGGSKPIIVNDPHIDVTDGPLLLREGVFNKRNDFYDLNIQISAFENGTAVGPANWLKNIEYLKYIKIAVFVSFYENTIDGAVPQNYTTKDILDLQNPKDKREISNTIIYDALGLSKLPYNSLSKPEQYEIFSFGSLINSADDYIKFQDDDGNYIIPLSLTLKFPKETNHLQAFAIPFLDLESLAFDYKISIKETVSIKDILEEPFYHTINIIKDGESQDSDIIVNSIITNEISKIDLKLPKDDILPTLNVDKNKVFNSTSISNLYRTKNELNQEVLFFFINSKDLIIKNSPFANSLINKQIPDIIRESLKNSTFKINLISDRKKVSKANNKLGNQFISTKEIKNSINKKYIENLTFIPNFIDDFELYYYVGDEIKENNIVDSYELEIIIKDNLLETLIDYYTILNSNFSQVKNYAKIIEIPYVKERTFLIDNPHIDVESTEGEVTLPSFGFYDLSSNSIKNIPLLEKQIENLNIISGGKYYSTGSIINPIQNFASKIENDLLSVLNFVIPLFGLDDSMIKNLKILNLIKPETASIETINVLLNIHKDIIQSIGNVLSSFGSLPEKTSGVSGSKKKAIIKYNYDFKDAVLVNNYFNNFKINKFTPVRVNNSPFPIASLSDIKPQTYFTPKFATLFGNQFQLDKEQNTTINSDLARTIQYFYQLVNKDIQNSQDIYSMVNKEQKENEAYSSFASLLSNETNIDIVYIATNNINAKQKINSYSYNFIYSSKQQDKKEINNSNLIDKSSTLINELEENINSTEISKVSNQKQNKKIKKAMKMFNVKASDISEGIDKFITQLSVAPDINLETINLSQILPNFKIEVLMGFENNNLSLPIWKLINENIQISDVTSPMFCRILIDSTEVTNKQLINKAISKLEYPNKYFIIGI